MHEFGFASHLGDHHFWPKKTPCSAPVMTKATSETEKLTLRYLSSAFILLIMGAGLAMLSFIFELVIFLRTTSRQKMSVKIVRMSGDKQAKQGSPSIVSSKLVANLVSVPLAITRFRSVLLRLGLKSEQRRLKPDSAEAAYGTFRASIMERGLAASKSTDF